MKLIYYILIITTVLILNCKEVSIVNSKYNVEKFVCLKLTQEKGYIMYKEFKNDVYTYTVQVQQPKFENNYTYYIRNFQENELENCR